MTFLKKIIKKILFPLFLSSTDTFTEEEVQALIDVLKSKGAINEEENEMIHGVLELKDTIVRNIMIPRTQIISISSDKTISELFEIIKGDGHSKIPVSHDNLDNIVGIITLKDVIKSGKVEFDSLVVNYMREPFFVPETMHIEMLLNNFKKEKTHIAVVLDEFGGTSGLITVSDVLEEIVGEIQDEYDEENVERIKEVGENQFSVDGSLPIEELEELFNLEIEKDKFETISGLIYNCIGRIPATGEKVYTSNLEFVIESADERKINRVLIKK